MKILGLFFSVILFFSCSDDLRQDIASEEALKNRGLIEFNIYGTGNITFSVINKLGDVELYENLELPISIDCGESIYTPNIKFVLSTSIPTDLYINITKNSEIYMEYYY